MIRHPKEEELPRLFVIWERCFGDPKDYISLFFQMRYRPEDTLVIEEDGEVAAVLYLLPCSVQNGGQGVPARYVYAAATDPDYGGRGLMTRLLAGAASYAREQGAKQMVLVPGSKALFSFYEKRGYRTSFFIKKGPLPLAVPGGETVLLKEDAGADRLLAIRRCLLKETPHIGWDERALSHVAEETRLGGGKILTLQEGGEEGYAICRPGDEEVLISELMVPDCLFPKMAAAIRALYPGKKVICRTAPGILSGLAGTVSPFGMSLDLTGNGKTWGNGAYLGLPMD